MPTTLEQFSLRRATMADVERLFDIHRAALKEYVAATWGWDELWQLDFFRKQFQPETRLVIEVQGEAVGFLDVSERDDAISLENIELNPTHQGRGIGTAIIRSVIRRAETARLPLRLQVLKVNKRAQALYDRLGFHTVGETDTHVLMALNNPRLCDARLSGKRLR
jgi:ribosomal protein S18 acetylase RimI-like enzyme